MCSSRTRKHLMGFLILAILLCEMCFFLQSADTSSFCVQTTQSTKHVTHAQISDGSKVVYEERISKTPDAGAESFAKVNSVPCSLVFVDCLLAFRQWNIFHARFIPLCFYRFPM